MEPVKGGSLVNLPEDAQKVLDELHGGSNASYAIRFAASFPGIRMVLSGMGSTEMMADNCGFMKDFQPLNEEERMAIARVCAIFRGQGLIPCTGCRYCTEVCPQGIPIPDLFACMNTKSSSTTGTATITTKTSAPRTPRKPPTASSAASVKTSAPST